MASIPLRQVSYACLTGLGFRISYACLTIPTFPTPYSEFPALLRCVDVHLPCAHLGSASPIAAMRFGHPEADVSTGQCKHRMRLLSEQWPQLTLLRVGGARVLFD